MRLPLLMPMLALFALPVAAPAQDGAKVYKQVVPSVVWVHSTRDRGMATGSGTLVDKEKRLVLTNYHVVGDNPTAKVFFPVFRDGKPIAEREYYLDRRNRLGIPGKVIALDKKADIALIRIEAVAKDVEAVPLAADSPDTGANTHTIGNAGASGSLFGYVKGTVRQVYRKKWAAELEPRRVINFEAKVVETDSPTNPGDSGGPLVNDKGELIGVTEGGATDAQLLSLFVDLSEVKKLLRRRSVVALRTLDASEPSKPKEPLKPAREKALESKDAAKLFGAEAWKKVEPAVEKLFKEKGTDLLIETVEVPPKSTPEKVKAMSPEEREKFFHEVVTERVKADKIQGVYILICKSPTYLYVGPTGDAAFPTAAASKIREALLTSLREKKFDEGLSKVLQMSLDAKGLGEKK